jgi:beta-N-acetylhexosaminidase
VGNVPWGLPDDGAVLGGSDHVDVGPRSSTDELAALASGGRALVALVREPQRHEWVGDVLRRLAERRPDLVTVDMGWPGPDPLPGCAVVRTFGASRANARALDNVLAGSGPR